MKALATIFTSLFFFALSYQADGGGVARCYKCESSCENPLDQEVCPQETGGEYVCMSMEKMQGNSAILTKGCYPKTIEKLCKSADESNTITCYTCNEDLCNEKNDNKTGVKTCYSCNGTCTIPLVQEQCPDGTNYVCLSSFSTLNSTIIQERKGCYLDTTIEECEKIDGLESSWCYTCDEDLCNAKNNSNNGVRKCYQCQGTCNDPLDQEECPSVNEGKYICMASKNITNGTVNELRGCFLETDHNCNETDTKTDDSCYTCDEDLCNNAGDNNGHDDDDDDDDNNSAEIYSISFLYISFSFLIFDIF